MDILKWIMNHTCNRQATYYEVGNKTQHIVKWENGDTYQHIEIYYGIMKKHIETIINGKTVKNEDLEYDCFGWKVIKN